MSRRRRYSYVGRTALSDFDPEIGEIVRWKKGSASVRIRFFGKRYIVTRNARCIFFQDQGTRVHEFVRGYLLCKVREFKILGHPENDRQGSVFTAAWHRMYATGYQERHIGGEEHVELYAITIGDRLVYRPFEYQEISARLPRAAGPVSQDLLCTL